MKVTAYRDIAPCTLVETDRRFRGTYFIIRMIMLTIIALMMETVRTIKSSVWFYPTAWRYIPEGCHFHSRCRENLKSQLSISFPAYSRPRTHCEPQAGYRHRVSLILPGKCKDRTETQVTICFQPHSL
jgi:hypothetical protein